MTSISAPIYSFVVPIYEDGYLAKPFCEAIHLAMSKLLGTSEVAALFEVIFVNDGSRNNSQDLLAEASRMFPFVKVIELSRNFGQHVAVSCGYRFAVGRYVGMINVDQQDPPDQIGVVLAGLNNGSCDIAVGLRSERGDSLLNTVLSRAFHALLNLLTGSRTPIHAASLRIMTRPFVDAYNALSEKTPYIPGLENWLGFKHVYIPIRHQRRQAGKSSYTFRRRWRMAVESIIGFSDVPLRLAAALGFFITCIGMLLGLGQIVHRIVFNSYVPGYTSTISAIIFLGGLNLLFLGLLSLYVGRILREVQGRPRFIVKSFEGFRLRQGSSEEDSSPLGLTSRDKPDILEQVSRQW